MVEKEIWQILSSARNGELTEEEREVLNTWLNERPENKRVYDTIFQLSLKDSEPTSVTKSTVFSKVQQKIFTEKYTRKIRLLVYGNVASIIALIALGSVLFFLRPESDLSQNTIITRCPLGSKSEVTLTDGSKVFLNSGSSLSYPSSFNKKVRKVILNGEGFFEIQKDMKRTFIVETGDIQVKVLGTKFNLKNYETDNYIETTLVEGAIEFSNNDNRVILKPNENLTYNKINQEFIKKKVDGELFALWKDGKYFFNDEPFWAIARKLERNFNVRIEIRSKALQDEVFSGLIDKNRSIYQILEVMRSYSKFNYSVKNDSIVIYK